MSPKSQEEFSNIRATSSVDDVERLEKTLESLLLHVSFARNVLNEIREGVEQELGANEVPFKPQSAEVTATTIPTGTESQHLQQETMQFMDEAQGQDVGMNSEVTDVQRSDITPMVGLGDFLMRPLRIASFVWTEASSTGQVLTTLNPWSLYFQTPQVQYKLNNYAFLRCDMKIKIMINASPFYYGAVMVSYQPASITPTTIQNDSGTRFLIPYSQRPHVWIYPTSQEGAEMTLPFFHYKNMVNAQSAQNLSDLGTLTFLIYAPLQSANGTTGAGVSIQVYAWPENLEVSGPSAGLAAQSRPFVPQAKKGDEYGKGIVSAPATAVANIASAFKRLPVIGRFATATEIGANVISAAARVFGFTNVPVISDAEPVKVLAFPNLATTDVGYPIEKLTIDSKNELTVDPGSLGINVGDELAITSFAGRESYVCSIPWSTGDVADITLFSTLVTPNVYDNDGGAFNKLYFTPMGLLCQLFQQWRGDVIFRFRFIVSPFHKGRVRLSYDPSGYSAENIISDANTTNVVHTQIVDIGKDSDVEFRIPYQQATSWLQCHSTSLTQAGIPFSTSHTPSFQYNPAFHNGTFTIRVSNVLTAPILSSSVNILFSVRAAENFEFANPCNPIQTLSPFAPQSRTFSHPNRFAALQSPPREAVLPNRPLHQRNALLNTSITSNVQTWWKERRESNHKRVSFANCVCGFSPCRSDDIEQVFVPQSHTLSDPMEIDSQAVVAGNAPAKTAADRYRANFGECISSLRTILRRFCLSYVYLNNTDPNDVISYTIMQQSKYPLYYGFDAHGLHSAKGLILTTSNFPFNFVSVMPYHLIAPCFIAQRGSMNWAFNVDGVNSISSIKMVRMPVVSGTTFNTNFAAASGTDSFNSSFYRSHVDMGAGGQVLTSQWTQAGLNVALPNYTQYRWQNTAPTNVTLPSSTDGSDKDFSQLELSFNNGSINVHTKVWKYASIGTDWSCYFFLNVPTFWNYGSDPTPN